MNLKLWRTYKEQMQTNRSLFCCSVHMCPNIHYKTWFGVKFELIDNCCCSLLIKPTPLRLHSHILCPTTFFGLLLGPSPLFFFHRVFSHPPVRFSPFHCLLFCIYHLFISGWWRQSLACTNPWWFWSILPVTPGCGTLTTWPCWWPRWALRTKRYCRRFILTVPVSCYTTPLTVNQTRAASFPTPPAVQITGAEPSLAWLVGTVWGAGRFTPGCFSELRGSSLMGPVGVI